MPDFKRQNEFLRIEDYNDNLHIDIIGCGATGSFIALCLSKIGLKKFTIWDIDKVEEHNLPNQLFGWPDLNSLKTDSTAHYMHIMNKCCRVRKNEKYNGEKLKSNIVISCVDTMLTRKMIFENLDKRVMLFIDTRMSALEGQVYCIDMENEKEKKFYEESLFTDAQAVQERCTRQSLLFTILGIASVVCRNIMFALKEGKVKNYTILDFTNMEVM